MHASTAQVTNLPQLVLMEWHVSTMFSLVHARPSSKATRMKSVRSHLTRKETRSSRRVATRRAGFGRRRREMRFSAWEPIQVKVTKMKSSPAPSTTRETLSSRGQRTTLAVSGRMSISFERTRRSNNNRLLELHSSDQTFIASSIYLFSFPLKEKCKQNTSKLPTSQFKKD